MSINFFLVGFIVIMVSLFVIFVFVLYTYLEAKTIKDELSFLFKLSENVSRRLYDDSRN